MAELHKKRSGKSPHKALTHPIRVQILGAMRQLGTASPVKFTRQCNEMGKDNSLNVIAYHFRVLSEMDVIELAEKIPRRGATEHVYRINHRSPVPDMLRATELMQRVGMASKADWSEEFIASGPGPVTIVPVQVDLQGQQKLNELLASVASDLKALEEECSRRLADLKSEGISVRVGLATYQFDSANVAHSLSH